MVKQNETLGCEQRVWDPVAVASTHTNDLIKEERGNGEETNIWSSALFDANT